MHILLVDDDQFIREAMTDYLIREKHSVTAVTNAEEALTHLKIHKPHLMITDVHMGEGMNGHQLYDEAKKIRFDLQIIIMTANATVERAVSSVQSGAVSYLAKPFDFDVVEKLLLKVAEILSKNIYSLAHVEQEHVEKIVEVTDNLSIASDVLGINMSTLWRKRKEYKMKMQERLASKPFRQVDGMRLAA
jgi:DNA-binding NtrC family response regulator